MKNLVAVMILSAGLFLVGCTKKEDPRDRPGFVDTSDPSTVTKTMTPLPKSKGTGGMNPGGAGPGAPKQP